MVGSRARATCQNDAGNETDRARLPLLTKIPSYGNQVWPVLWPYCWGGWQPPNTGITSGLGPGPGPGPTLVGHYKVKVSESLFRGNRS